MAACCARTERQNSPYRFHRGKPATRVYGAQYGSFQAELREQGFEEGRNIVIDYKRSDDPHGPFAASAELMRSQADLIVATGTEAALQAVIGASRSIPIVFLAVQSIRLRGAT